MVLSAVNHMEDPPAELIVKWIEANAVRIIYYRNREGKPYVRLRYEMASGRTNEITGASLIEAVKNALRSPG